LLAALLSLPVQAQTESIPWTTNIEAAKAEARQTGRFVLVHFFTEDCAPCKALERNVFAQPEVGNALKTQFVFVKLDANDNPATAGSMGISRVPTDVVITPDGEVIGKLISPATPMAYVSELSQLASKYGARSGQAYAGAVASAPQPSQINSVYAGLQIAPSTPPALGESSQPVADNRIAARTPFGAPPAGRPPVAPTFAAAGVVPPVAAPVTTPTPPASQPTPSMINNQFAQTAPVAAPPTAQFGAGAFDPNASRYAPGPTMPPANAVAGPAFATPPPTPAVNPPAANPYATTTPGLPVGNEPQTPPLITYSPNATPDPRQLPPGAMPLGFDGFCPVSMRNSNLTKWVPGNPQFGVQHRGRTYWFAGPQEKQQFWANPDLYAPALSGLDSVLAIDHRQQVPGRREHSVDYDNVFYMFSSEASLQQFTANPERYAAGVRQAMGIQTPRRTLR
jgi:YHS domain-containing protein/thiol-disulfide isomerase/thioredoxin